MTLISLILWATLTYIFIGMVIYLVSLPTYSRYTDTDYLKLYMWAWPIELYRMYTHSQDGDY